MGMKKNLNPLKISEQICQFSLCRDSSVGNIVPCFCFRLRIYTSMESSVSNRFRMVIFSLHCLKEFPNSTATMYNLNVKFIQSPVTFTSLTCFNSRGGTSA